VTLKSGQSISKLEKGRFEGFLRAGLVIGVTTHSEMQQLLEDVHFRVFNKTIAERKKDQKTWFPEDAIDYEQFYRPTFERTSR
jgi:hypothetical protein